MPYLPVDLDAKRKAEDIEKALGLPRFSVLGGLIDLWEGAWRSKKDVADEVSMGAAFGPLSEDARLRLALVSREFLEPLDDGRGYRIRGAKKWLLGLEGRSRGGHAAKKNLVPGGKKKHVQPSEPKSKEEDSSAPAEGQPRASRGPAETHPSAESRLLHPASSIQHLEESKALSSSEESPEPDEMAPEAAQIREVFAYWQERLGHQRAKLDGKRRGVIRARLRDGRTADELKRAVDGCAATPHNMGQNDRGERYDDIELICRNDAQVERFIRNAQSPPRPPGNTKGRATEADKNWDGPLDTHTTEFGEELRF